MGHGVSSSVRGGGRAVCVMAQFVRGTVYVRVKRYEVVRLATSQGVRVWYRMLRVQGVVVIEGCRGSKAGVVRAAPGSEVQGWV